MDLLTALIGSAPGIWILRLAYVKYQICELEQKIKEREKQNDSDC